MDNLSDFLEHFNITQAEFESTKFVWNDLIKIRLDYESFKLELTPPANYLIEAFHSVKTIHSVRFRIKNSDHLVEKIIRKKLEEPERIIDISNYKTEITDLIGLRALHLFKEDWVSIHHFIIGNWNLKEEPIAYYRKGDSPEYIEVFTKFGCKVKEHPFGYRSVHYLVETSPNKTTYISEVQVRTIFEEGWSEIDHKIRYPYDKNNRLLNQFLVMFNRLSGNADEMGSYVQFLKKELDTKEKEFKDAVEKKISIIEDLKRKIKELELKPKIALQWQNELDEILKLSTLNINNFDLKLPDFTQIDLPELSKFQIPILPNSELLDMPVYPKFEMPDLSHLKIPDLPKIELPDLSKTTLQLKRNTQQPKSKNKSPDDKDKKDEK